MQRFTDNELVRMLRSPREREVNRAVSHLYGTCFPMVQKLVLENSGSTNDAPDVFQETINVFYEQIRRNLVLSCSIRTYVYAVARRLWLQKLRVKGRMVRFDSVRDDVIELPIALKLSGPNDLFAVLETILDRLIEQDRQVLVYFYFERLSMREIAERMGLANAQVAKNRKCKAMHRLKSLLRDCPQLRELLEAFL